MVLTTLFGGIHPNGSNNSMFLFKSHIQQHLSASISEFFNFPGFWVTSETRESICRTILAWLFILFNIKSRFYSSVMRFQHMMVPSAWKASCTGLTPIHLSHLRAKCHSWESLLWYFLLQPVRSPKCIFSSFSQLPFHCIDQVVAMYTYTGIWCSSVPQDVSSIGLNLFLITVPNA